MNIAAFTLDPPRKRGVLKKAQEEGIPPVRLFISMIENFLMEKHPGLSKAQAEEIVRLPWNAKAILNFVDTQTYGAVIRWEYYPDGKMNLTAGIDNRFRT